MEYFVVIVLGYLLGSIPPGFLVARLKGVDIRKEGSGNIGATNALRVLGKPIGITVLAADVLKGVAAAWALPQLILRLFGADSGNAELMGIIAGFSSILGHNYTCWLRFKGGKGIATSAGVLLGLTPLGLLISLSAFAIGITATRTVSVGSIAASAILPIGVWLTGGNTALIVVTAAMGAMAIWKHRPNIQRLFNGTEPKFGRGKSTGKTEAQSGGELQRSKAQRSMPETSEERRQGVTEPEDR